MVSSQERVGDSLVVRAVLELSNLEDDKIPQELESDWLGLWCTPFKCFSLEREVAKNVTRSNYFEKKSCALEH